MKNTSIYIIGANIPYFGGTVPFSMPNFLQSLFFLTLLLFFSIA